MTNNLEATSSCCSASVSTTSVSTTTSAPTPVAAANGRENLMASGAADDMTTCPVMVGNPVSKTAAEAAGLYRDYEGERYYFCCGGCGPAFDSDPARYATTMA